MTLIRKRTGDKGGCCSPYSELQLEIERVDQTAIDAKTTANDTKAYLNTINGKVNEAIAVLPQVETNTEAIAAHGAELMDHDARIHTNTIVNDQQNTDIANLKTKTNDNATAIETLENENGQNKIDIQEQGKDIAALKTKTNDNAAAIKTLEDEVGPETVAGTIQYRLKDIDTKLPTAIKEVEMIANASTVTHKATHISGTAESDALPVVSREQAGIMSASVYAAMEDVIANNTSRISVLEQSAPTYDISGLVGPNPTNAEISAAFQQKYPTVPIQAGLRAADYDNAHFWQYGKGTWIMLTQIDVQVATNQSLGIVKGSSTDGKIFVETDGSMSLKGYDALVSKDATHDSKINTLEVGLGNANARIDATNDNVANNAADIVAANGEIATNTNDISGLKGKMATAEGQIATHETKINQNTQSINGLSNDISGLNDRMSTAEGQIASHETKINQHTQSINGLSTDVNGLKTDVNGLKTDVNGLSTDVNGLKTDVNGLKTNKQDKLIAGSGILIGSDGKTISSYNEPINRFIHTTAQLKNEFIDLIKKGNIGDKISILSRITDNSTGTTLSTWGPYYESYLIEMGDTNYIQLYPISPIEVVNKINIDGKTQRTIYYEGYAYYQAHSGSFTSKGGKIFITVNENDDYYTMSIYDNPYVDYFSKSDIFYFKGNIKINTSTTNLNDLTVIANYNPKS